MACQSSITGYEYSTSTSWIETSVTTSTRVIFTPTPEVSTSVFSSCVSTETERPASTSTRRGSVTTSRNPFPFGNFQAISGEVSQVSSVKDTSPVMTSSQIERTGQNLLVHTSSVTSTTPSLSIMHSPTVISEYATQPLPTGGNLLAHITGSTIISASESNIQTALRTSVFSKGSVTGLLIHYDIPSTTNSPKFPQISRTIDRNSTYMPEAETPPKDTTSSRGGPRSSLDANSASSVQHSFRHERSSSEHPTSNAARGSFENADKTMAEVSPTTPGTALSETVTTARREASTKSSSSARAVPLRTSVSPSPSKSQQMPKPTDPTGKAATGTHMEPITSAKAGMISPPKAVHEPGRKRFSQEDHSKKVGRQHCELYTTITRLITVDAPPTTTWSDVVITSSIPSIVTIPTRTLYNTCEATTVSEADDINVHSSSAPPSAPISSFVTTSKTTMQVLVNGSTSSRVSTSLAPASTVTSEFSLAILAPASNSLATDTSPPSTIAGHITTQIQQQKTLSSTSSSSDTTVTAQNAVAESTTGASTGAIIGGIFGVLLLITMVLCSVRWWAMRKRIKRTNELRSSWFYGGDIAEPDQNPSSEPVSRFSAPSLMTNRSSRVPAFLTLPVSHLPGPGIVLNAIRQSLRPSRREETDHHRADKYMTHNGDPEPPLPPRPDISEPMPMLMRSIPSGQASNPDYNPSIPAVPTLANLADMINPPTMTVANSTVGSMSMYSANSFYPPVDSDGNEHVDGSEQGMSFPLPPRTLPFPPPQGNAPDQNSLFPPPLFDINHASSIFEYTNYAQSGRESLATTKSRETDRTTRAWYDKPLWDGQVDGSRSIHRDGDGGKSVKSVRWGDDTSDGIARAL